MVRDSDIEAKIFECHTFPVVAQEDVPRLPCLAVILDGMTDIAMLMEICKALSQSHCPGARQQ
jgi:hypothetical protein